MADKSKSAPNFYSTLAESAGGGAPGGPGGGMSPSQSKPGTDPGKKGEKAQNIATLLEVFKKMDAMEDDPAGKDLLQQMLNLGMKYKTMIDGGPGAAGGAGAPPPPGPDAGGPGGPGASGMPPPSPPMPGAGGQVP